MTEYLLAVHEVEGEEPPAEDVIKELYANVDVFNEKLKANGAWVFAGGLHPADVATVVKEVDGEVVTTDGPFAETKEHIGGFWVIEAPDLDKALEWAREATVACASPVEVRPFQG